MLPFFLFVPKGIFVTQSKEHAINLTLAAMIINIFFFRLVLSILPVWFKNTYTGGAGPRVVSRNSLFSFFNQIINKRGGQCEH